MGKHSFASRKKLKKAANGQYLRPAYGPCPGCNQPEKKYCLKTCPFLDPAHMARE